MILSHYERADSPFVWIQYSSDKGPKRYRKTRIRKDDPEKAFKLAKAMNQAEAELLSAPAPARAGSWAWVGDFLRQRYHARAATLRCYTVQWNWLRSFLEYRGIRSPASFTREHAFDYLSWRTSQVKQKSRRSPGVNTAIGELKLLGLILDEALARGLCERNEARKLNIERAQPLERPEMTDADIRLIYESLRPPWMVKSFHVALHTGLRFSETAIKREQVRVAEQQIVIDAPKGGRKRGFAIPIYPPIARMIEDFMASGQAALWALPHKERKLTGIYWTRFFRSIGLNHLCFHCTRVTFVTRGARAGVPEGAMMKMVNHASKEIHRIYQRVTSADALRYHSQIPIPTYVASTE